VGTTLDDFLALARGILGAMITAPTLAHGEVVRST
jgi:hypothetical protein